MLYNNGGRKKGKGKNMKTRKIQKQGISLIVLVITIIVMIILAAAIILSLSSSGIIDRANDAVEKTDLAQVQTMASTIWADVYLKYIDGEIQKEDIKSEVIKGLEKNNIEIQKYRVLATETGVEVTLKDRSLNHYGTIPEGATMYIGDFYVGVNKEIPRGDYSRTIATYESGDVFPGSEDDVIEGCPIHFCREYGIEMEGTILKWIFYSNGAIIAHQDGNITDDGVGMVTYDGNKIYLGDMLMGTVSDDGKEITMEAGGAFKLLSDTPSYIGALYSYGDYDYLYIEKESEFRKITEKVSGYTLDFFESGWNPFVIDTNKTEYGAVLESINGQDITNMMGTYSECTLLSNISNINIPSTVTYALTLFWGCTSLVDASGLKIPNGIISMQQTFRECTSLTVAPDLSNCKNLINLVGTYYRCTSLKTYAGSKDADGDFSNYLIPNSVIHIGSDLLGGIFQDCTLLTGAITLNITPETYANCLKGTQITQILGDCKIKDKILATKNY